jgi:hypothetical protein
MGSGLGLTYHATTVHLECYHAVIGLGLGLSHSSSSTAAAVALAMGYEMQYGEHPTSRSPQKKIGFWLCSCRN